MESEDRHGMKTLLKEYERQRVALKERISSVEIKTAEDVDRVTLLEAALHNLSVSESGIRSYLQEDNRKPDASEKRKTGKPHTAEARQNIGGSVLPSSAANAYVEYKRGIDEW